MNSRWKVTCAYDGTAFAGWQSQPGANALQDVIEARLQALAGSLIRIHASGRTDAGVHALGQVFHFDLPWRHGPERLKAALRVGLPAQLQIRTVEAVDSTFHARFSATRKRYEYRVYEGDADPFTRPFVWAIERPIPLDVEAMRQSAALLEGTHDFKAFSAYNGSDREDTLRTLRRLDIRRRSAELRIVAEADGFLYKMVRSLVGALISVGLHKLSQADVQRLLQARVRTAEVETAPAQGLCLMRVYYSGKPRRIAEKEDDDRVAE